MLRSVMDCLLFLRLLLFLCALATVLLARRVIDTISTPAVRDPTGGHVNDSNKQASRLFARTGMQTGLRWLFLGPRFGQRARGHTFSRGNGLDLPRHNRSVRGALMKGRSGSLSSTIPFALLDERVLPHAPPPWFMGVVWACNGFLRLFRDYISS